MQIKFIGLALRTGAPRDSSTNRFSMQFAAHDMENYLCDFGAMMWQPFFFEALNIREISELSASQLAIRLKHIHHSKHQQRTSKKSLQINFFSCSKKLV